MNVDMRAFIIDWDTGKITVDHGVKLLLPKDPPDEPYVELTHEEDEEDEDAS